MVAALIREDPDRLAAHNQRGPRGRFFAPAKE